MGAVASMQQVWHSPDWAERWITGGQYAQPRVSFEFFPPKNRAMTLQLWRVIRELESLNPAFVSVTYGAGGTTRERTHQTVRRMVRETGLKPAAHLTCVSATREEVDAVARKYWQAGVRHIVALRGDAPAGSAAYTPHPGGYAYAADLVKGLKAIGDFEISVAAYPETHPEALSAEQDLDNLKRKIDAGATRAITQYFFDLDVFLRFMERARRAGITVPIIPGVLPVGNLKQLVKFSAMCGASVPDWIHQAFDGLDGLPHLHQMVAACIVAEQCRLLQKAGCEDIHFYTLNRAELVRGICHLLGVRPQAQVAG